MSLVLKVEGYKIDTQKTTVFMSTHNDQREINTNTQYNLQKHQKYKYLGEI